MEWMWIIGWLVIGIVIFGLLWKHLKIDWSAEAADTKLLMVVTPFLWPLVLLFVAGIWVLGKIK